MAGAGAGCGWLRWPALGLELRWLAWAEASFVCWGWGYVRWLGLQWLAALAGTGAAYFGLGWGFVRWLWLGLRSLAGAWAAFVACGCVRWLDLGLHSLAAARTAFVA